MTREEINSTISKWKLTKAMNCFHERLDDAIEKRMKEAEYHGDSEYMKVLMSFDWDGPEGEWRYWEGASDFFCGGFDEEKNVGEYKDGFQDAMLVMADSDFTKHALIQEIIRKISFPRTTQAECYAYRRDDLRLHFVAEYGVSSSWEPSEDILGLIFELPVVKVSFFFGDEFLEYKNPMYGQEV